LVQHHRSIHRAAWGRTRVQEPQPLAQCFRRGVRLLGRVEPPAGMHLPVLARVGPVTDAAPTALDPHASQAALAVGARVMLVLHVLGVARDPQVLPSVVERVPVHVVANLPVPVDEAEDLAMQEDEALNSFLPAMQPSANVAAGDSPAVAAEDVKILVIDQEENAGPVTRFDDRHERLDGRRPHRRTRQR
jgi:hypothetical protein